MSDKSRAKKLAAAKRKLKEYHQLKGKQQNVGEVYDNDDYSTGFKIDTMSESERSEDTEKGSILQSSNEKLDNTTGFDLPQKQSKKTSVLKEVNGTDSNIHIDAIEMLIAEKAALSTQVTKLQTSCKEKDLEIEEISTMLHSAKKRIESLEKATADQNAEITNLRTSLDEMRAKISTQESEMTKYKRQCEEQAEHIEELKHELSLGRMKIDEMEAELKDKSCQLELYKIRINQISEEANVATDNRVEDLMQMKFVHEQQIKDLEAMVKQISAEKEQASQQYQNYVQHLNKEISTLSEKNLELLNERSKLLDHEKTMISHIAALEKQIQDNMVRQESFRTNEKEQANSSLFKENLALKEEVENLKKQRDDLDSTIRSQESKIIELSTEIEESQSRIQKLEKQNEELRSVQPDNAKLLAAIESDKVAASRAVAQNEELKKQLEEIQLKLIQVTNEKVDLVELLHSEQHTNREMRANYEQMSDNLKQTTEKLHFKDEEMIRLTHENNELNKKILQLNQQVDRLMHYEAKEYVQNYADVSEGSNHNNVSHIQGGCSHSDNHECGDKNEVVTIMAEKASEALHSEELIFNADKMLITGTSNECKIATDLPATEAMQKLQDRFKTLMGEVADLTDEKQRLEHLVLQLQGETETIGEYIALYQTQRRMLKQREIEKNTQLHRLLTEREEMKEKIIELTQLINNLEVKSENTKKEIIKEKIHSIISDIKDKDNVESKPAGTVDHCACCSGKFETI